MVVEDDSNSIEGPYKLSFSYCYHFIGHFVFSMLLESLFKVYYPFILKILCCLLNLNFDNCCGMNFLEYTLWQILKFARNVASENCSFARCF